MSPSVFLYPPVHLYPLPQPRAQILNTLALGTPHLTPLSTSVSLASGFEPFIIPAYLPRTLTMWTCPLGLFPHRSSITPKLSSLL